MTFKAIKRLAALLAFVGTLPAWPTAAQPSTAKADGKAFGREKAISAQAAATTDPDAARIPNFDKNPMQSGYFDNPDAMARAATGHAATHDGYRALRSSVDNRVRFAPIDLDATIARSKAINEDPLSFTSGMAVSGTQGRCVPLPSSNGIRTRYFATCNIGYSVTQASRSCQIPLAVQIDPVSSYHYYAEAPFHTGIAPGISEFADELRDGTCHNIGAANSCQVVRAYGLRPSRRCANYRTDIVECSRSLSGLSGLDVPATGTRWFAQTIRNQVSTLRNESQCAPLASNPDCVQDAESCTDSDPVTRIINSVAITQPCWAWARSYTCQTFTAAEDCETLAQTPGCTLVREDCLTDEPCRTWERVYDCPVPDQPALTNQFICDGDVHCIDGSCETIERQANDEFKDAVVALNAMNQARREFDPNSLTLFRGTRNSCSSKVFGVLNCCKGKGFPLISGISLLVALGCNAQELLLQKRDAQGLCAYVGTYCSDSFLGACLTKKKVYCCFESKLSRVLQEQGRKQLPKPWGKPKTESCAGFTIDEFARLDLSQMDFSEVYAEFIAAARLPDELEAATQIQQKIEDYYANAQN